MKRILVALAVLASPAFAVEYDYTMTYTADVNPCSPNFFKKDTLCSFANAGTKSLGQCSLNWETLDAHKKVTQDPKSTVEAWEAAIEAIDLNVVDKNGKKLKDWPVGTGSRVECATITYKLVNGGVQPTQNYSCGHCWVEKVKDKDGPGSKPAGPCGEYIPPDVEEVRLNCGHNGNGAWFDVYTNCPSFAAYGVKCSNGWVNGVNTSPIIYSSGGDEYAFVRVGTGVPVAADLTYLGCEATKKLPNGTVISSGLTNCTVAVSGVLKETGEPAGAGPVSYVCPQYVPCATGPAVEDWDVEMSLSAMSVDLCKEKLGGAKSNTKDETAPIVAKARKVSKGFLYCMYQGPKSGLTLRRPFPAGKKCTITTGVWGAFECK